MRRPFQFKQFKVTDQNSAMKVNTDAVLLGAWCDAEHATRILDIGTGCGIIALMNAQRSNARIDAIDIHEQSIKDAAENFSTSPWTKRLKAIHISIQQFSKRYPGEYDLIVCNPPFFQNSLVSPDEARTRSKHTILLNHEELLDSILTLLNEKGIFSLILPPVEMMKFDGHANIYGFYLKRQLKVRPRSGNPVNRVLAEYCRGRTINPEFKEMIIRNKDNSLTTDHQALTSDFYLSSSQKA